MSSIIPSSTAPAHIHPAAKEARQWIWIGYIIGLIILLLVFLGGIANVLWALAWAWLPFWSPLSMLGGIFQIVYCVIGFFVLVTMVKPKLIDAIDRGDYASANKEAMMVGILALIFAGVITGILIILAKSKLEEALAGPPSAPAPPPPPSPV